MRRHVPDPESGGAALAALAATVDRLGHAISSIGALETALARHDAAINEIADLIRTPQPAARTDPSTTRPLAPPAAGSALTGSLAAGSVATGSVAVDWVTVTDPAVAVLTLAWLTQWVARVWDVYAPHPAEPLRPCWPWHPDIVAELLAAAHTHTAATDTDGPADALTAWHDRWRPGAHERITGALAPCARATAATGYPVHHWTPAASTSRSVSGLWVADPATGDELAVWWATHPASRTPIPPGLTPTGPDRHPDGQHDNHRADRHRSAGQLGGVR